ncbi:UNVERIFIED_ORG: MFS family permease [Paraburkholderia sediminicola]|uniref:MFS transporter n=1 Tax=Paraburkholderia aspalathi TaxID=1324617 RepID=UPI0021125248|nr:MFS family permease [Paraburkholderia sediminicola]
MDQSSFSGRSLPGTTWQTYVLDLLRAPRQAKAALVGCFILMTLSPAGLSAMMPFITASFAHHTGKPMPEAILVFVAIPLLISPFILPIAGAWVDRWGAKRVAIPASILYAAATALVPISSAFPGLLGVVIVLTSVFGFMASLAVVFKVVTGWFPRHRGVGFALIGAVSSLANALLSPLFQWMIDGDESGFAGLGWTGTYYAVAAAIAVFAVPAALFLLSEPALETSEPAFPKPPSKVNLKDIPGVPMGKALRSRTWIFIALSLALAAAGPMAVRQNAVNFFAERGFDPATVAVSQSVLFVASIVGLFFGGMILDRSRRPWVIVPLLATVPTGLVLSYFNHGNVLLLFVSTAFLGFATGAESSLGPFLIARYFGLKCFAQLQGLTLAISTLTLGLAPFLVSAMQTAIGSYTVPFGVLTALTALAVLFAFLLPPYPAEWTHRTEQDRFTRSAGAPELG